MARPQTVVEKVLARAAGRDEVRPGDVVVVEVDRAVLIDMQFSSLALAWRSPRVVARPERIAVVLDHAVPAPSVRDANGAVRARAFAERFGIEDFFDVGAHGICHQVIAELGLARPGELLVCSDSHTCAGGAFNTAARGVGGLEMLQVACTGRTWFVVAPTVRVDLHGAPAEGCEGKDVFLALGGRFGSAEGRNLELGGPGVSALSLHDRRTIATQAAELDAEFCILPADETVLSYLTARGVGGAAPVDPDEGAEYDARWQLDLSTLEPQVAAPGKVVGNVSPVSAAAGTRLDQCFIGSCANGHLEDLRVAAETLRGRRVARGVRLVVTPASQKVYLDAVRAGYVETLVEAGAVVTSSTCGACFGYHMGVLGEGEVCLTASTRNFKGRMGSPDSEVWMASTRTVAASALTGEITDPRSVR